MDAMEIDWNFAWQNARSDTFRDNDPSYWDKRAPSFARHVRETDYEKQFLEMMQPQRFWSVLDVGCGAGTLALPLSRLVASVTAVDFSAVMLELLRNRCLEEGVSNITTIRASWSDDWEALGIGTYDVVIASRSLVAYDLRDAVLKLDRAARRRVHVSSLVGDGPHDRRIYQAVGRPFTPGPDYIYLYNLLYQMGIRASVNFIPSREWKAYKTLEDAVDGTSWMLKDILPEELKLLREYLASVLVPHEGKLRFPEPKVVRWAMITWEKEE